MPEPPFEELTLPPEMIMPPSLSSLLPMIPSLTIPATPPLTSPEMVIWVLISLPSPI